MMHLLFKHTRSTKGAHVFVEVDKYGKKILYPQYKVGTLYIRKTAMPDVALSGLQVEIKPTSFEAKESS